MPRPTLTVRELFWRHPFTQIGFGCLALALVDSNLLLLRFAKRAHWNDFGKFYYGTLNWLHGGSLYAPTIATKMAVGTGQMEFLNLNPPHFHFIVLPLVYLSELSAGVAWVVLNICSALLACGLIQRELNLRIHPTRVLPWLCLCLASAATGANAMTVQCTGLLLVPMTAAWLTARRNRWTTCGVLLGVLISLKPFLGLFLVTLALQRQWRACAAAGLAAAAAVLLGVFVFGGSAYFEWLGTLGGTTWAWTGINGSLRGLLARALDLSPTFESVAVRPRAVASLWLLASSVVMLASVPVARRSVDHAFGVTILVSLLVSPLGWVYYLWWAVPGCAALWSERLSIGVWLGLSLSCIPLFSIFWWQPSALATLTVGSAYTYATLALWLGVCATPVPGRPSPGH